MSSKHPDSCSFASDGFDLTPMPPFKRIGTAFFERWNIEANASDGSGASGRREAAPPAELLAYHWLK